MNQMTNDWMKSNELMTRLFKAIEGIKKPDMEVITSIQRQMEINIKRINAHVAMAQTMINKKESAKRWERMNLEGDEAIDLMLGDPEVDKIKCPEHDNLITRSECLDFSGDNIETCSGCEMGKITKEKLCPEFIA